MLTNKSINSLVLFLRTDTVTTASRMYAIMRFSLPSSKSKSEFMQIVISISAILEHCMTKNNIPRFAQMHLGNICLLRNESHKNLKLPK